MSYYKDIFFDKPRSVEARLYRAIESLLPDSVEKILASGKVVIQNEEWDSLRVIADAAIDDSVFPIFLYRDNSIRLYSIEKYKNGLNILEQLMKYGAFSYEIYGYNSPLNMFIKKGLVEYVEVCLKYGIKFTLSELYIVVQNVDIDIFRLAQKYGIYYGYEHGTHEYFSNCPIFMLHEDPKKNTWGKIKDLDGYLDDKFFRINKRLELVLNGLIRQKNSFCINKDEQKVISREMNGLQRQYYYDRLDMMNGLLSMVVNDKHLLSGETIDFWKYFVDCYEENLIDCFGVQLTDENCNIIMEFFNGNLKNDLRDGKLTQKEFSERIYDNISDIKKEVSHYDKNTLSKLFKIAKNNVNKTEVLLSSEEAIIQLQSLIDEVGIEEVKSMFAGIKADEEFITALGKLRKKDKG